MEGFYRRGCLLAVAFLISISSFTAQAATRRSESADSDWREDVGDQNDEKGYDAIVNELTREADRPAQALKAKRGRATLTDPFDNVWIHFGVGLANLMETINFDDGKSLFLGQKGVQIAAGIDLFSPNWSAEGTYRGFGDADDSAVHASLQEFELKVFYKTRYAHNLNLRAGGGLSGRYLDIQRPKQALVEFATPSSVVTLGADFFMNDNVSVGADLSARNSMISDTLDRSSYDATLRVDTHF